MNFTFCTKDNIKSLGKMENQDKYLEFIQEKILKIAENDKQFDVKKIIEAYILLDK